MTTTAAITYIYRYFQVFDRTIAITRNHLGETNFPRNGNVHNPTQYYSWTAAADGKKFTASTRAVAYEYARAHLLGIPYRNVEGHPTVNVRDFRLVAAEMKANYRTRRVEA